MSTFKGINPLEFVYVVFFFSLFETSDFYYEKSMGED